MSDPTLPAALLLLALDSQTGLPRGKRLRRGLFGAALEELLLRGRITVRPGAVRAVDGSPTGNALCDVVLQAVGNFRAVTTAAGWLGMFERYTNVDLDAATLTYGPAVRDHFEALKQAFGPRLADPAASIAESLVDTGVLRRGPRTGEGVLSFHWITPLFEVDPAPRRLATEHLRAVFLHGVARDEPARALAALLWACDLLGSVFSEDEQERARQRLDEAWRDDLIAFAVRHRHADWRLR